MTDADRRRGPQLVCTCRLQLRNGVGFADVATLVPLLASMGVSHLYLSPIATAVEGSTHGYDAVDPTEIDPALGGRKGFDALSDAAEAAGLGIVVDVVPNHLATDGANKWWWDVMKRGRASVFSTYFDIDWAPPQDRLRNRIVVPVLGDHLGRVVARGEIGLERTGSEIEIRYFDHRFPTAPRSRAMLLRRAVATMDDAGSGLADRLRFFADLIDDLPDILPDDPVERARLDRDARVIEQLVADSIANDDTVATALDQAIASLQEDPAAVLAFLDDQHVRLAYWRAGNEQLDYRRFFDIDTLAGVRQEAPEVFEATHRLLLDLVDDGKVHGLRIDHPDGLRDPAGYVARLRHAAPDAWIVLEKILEADEQLPGWPADGTTGYDAAQLITGVLVDRAAAPALRVLVDEHAGPQPDLDVLIERGKRQVLDELLVSDHKRVVDCLVHICESTPEHRDHTHAELTQVVGELAVALDRYRTYVTPTTGSDEDIATIERAAGRVRATGAVDEDLLDFAVGVLSGRVRPPGWADFVARFQQLTGPLMAKGAEDTALYRDQRLLALNEVGAAPEPFGVDLETFHRRWVERQRRWPLAMNALTTHDTKRNADVRARLAVLADRPEAWAECVREVFDEVSDVPVDPETVLHLLQAAVGTHPITAERLASYAQKAVREAKVHTSWLDPDETYESRVDELAVRLATSASAARFAEEITAAGRANALIQVTLTCLAPGVPDLYQGDDLWNLALVDPDNRRPVDWQRRRELVGVSPADGGAVRDDEGLVKRDLWCRLLDLRRRRPDAFGPHGDYEGLAADGRQAERVLAFTRGGAVAVVACRFPGRDSSGFAETTLALPPGRWRNVLSAGGRIGSDREGVEGGVPVSVSALVPDAVVSVFEREG